MASLVPGDCVHRRVVLPLRLNLLDLAKWPKVSTTLECPSLGHKDQFPIVTLRSVGKTLNTLDVLVDYMMFTLESFSFRSHGLSVGF